MTDVVCVLDVKAELGEGPVWSEPEQALYWVDIREPALHRLHLGTRAMRTWPMPSRIGSFGLRERGGAVVALVDGFHLLDLDTGALTFIAGPEPVPGTRFNDGKVAPDGRFFAGTMDEERLSRPLGALYRLDPDLSVHRVVGDLAISNGLAWSADGSTMFHCDTGSGTVWAYDYADGSLTNRRVFTRPTSAIGLPDGAATDEEGCYWSAGVTAGVLNRWAPDGTLDRQVPLPCTSPTAPCFGGPDLRTIFVTSLRHGVDPAALAAKPLSGGVFAIRVDVPGVPVARFLG